MVGGCSNNRSTSWAKPRLFSSQVCICRSSASEYGMFPSQTARQSLASVMRALEMDRGAAVQRVGRLHNPLRNGGVRMNHMGKIGRCCFKANQGNCLRNQLRY